MSPTPRQAAVLARARARARAVEGDRREPPALLTREEVLNATSPVPPAGGVVLHHVVVCVSVPGRPGQGGCGHHLETDDGALAERWSRKHSGQGIKGGPKPGHGTIHRAVPREPPPPKESAPCPRP